MTPALFLTLLLAAPATGVHLPTGSQYSIAGSRAYIFDRDGIESFALTGKERRVSCEKIFAFLKEKQCTVNDISADSGRILVSGMENGNAGRVGFAAVFSESDQSRLSYWTVGTHYPVAQYLSGDTVVLAQVAMRGTPTPSASLSVKEYTVTGNFVRDRMTPVTHDDLDGALFLAALPYFQFQKQRGATLDLIDPLGPVVYTFHPDGRVTDLSISYKITQFLPIIRNTVFSSFFRCGGHTYAIVQGIRPTKKIIPYIMEVTPKGAVHRITALETIQVYHVEPTSDASFVAEYFDSSVRGRVLNRVSCNDLVDLAAK